MLKITIRKLPIALLALGLVMAFTASSAMALSRTTEKATTVDTTFATLNATISAGGDPTDYLFGWGLTSDPNNMNGATAKGTTESLSPIKVSAKLTGLEPSTTYYFTIATHDLVTNEYKNGAILSFTTPGYHQTAFMAQTFPASVSGSNNAAVEFEIGNPQYKVECSVVSLSQVSNLTAPATTFALSPFFESGQACKSSSGFGVKINAHTCRFVYNVANTVAPYTGTLGISCTKEGDVIEFADQSGCTFKVAQQNPAGSLSYTNESSGVVRAQGSPTGVKYTSNFTCELGGFPHTGENAVLGIDSTLKGDNGATQFYIAGHEQEVGVYTSSGNLEGSKYPLTLSGSNSAAFKLKILNPVTEFECATGTVSLTHSEAISGVTSSTTVLPSFPAKCKSSSGFGVEIKPNSCGLLLNFSGSMSVSCSKAGDRIEFKDLSGCYVYVGEQSLSGSITYTNQGSGTGRSIRAQGSPGGVKYTANFTCQLGGIPAEGENAVLTVDGALGGRYAG